MEVSAPPVQAGKTTLNQPPVKTKVASARKTNWRVSFILLILGILIGAGGLWVYQNYFVDKTATPTDNSDSTTPEEDSSTPDPTADWETYTNTEYGYSIKFPERFTTQLNEADALVREATPTARALYIYEKGEEESYLNRYVDISYYQVKPSYPETDWVTQEVTVNGIKAQKLSPKSPNAKFEVYIIELPSIVGVLEIYVSSDNAKKDEATQILSTFEFLD